MATDKYDDKLLLQVAQVIDEEAWKAIEDGRDALPDSIWHIRRDYAMQRAQRVLDVIVSHTLDTTLDALARNGPAGHA